MLHIYLAICCIIISTAHIIHSMDEDPSAQKPFFETQDKRKLLSGSSSKRKLSNDKDKLSKRSSDIPSHSQKTQNLLALYNISKSDPALHKSKRSSDDSETSPRVPSPRSLSPRSANKFLQRTTSSAKLSRTSDTKKRTFTLIEALKTKHPSSKIIKETLSLYISDPSKNINEQDEFKNTPLHYAILKRDALGQVMYSYYNEIMYPLLSNPRLDTTIKNDQDITAPQLIPYGEALTLSRSLFARTTLDIVIHEETFYMLIELSISDEIIKNIIETVEKKIRGLETKQGDTDLPEEALFPKYATKEFITEMIKHRSKKEQASINELYHENGSLAFFNPNPVDDIFTAAQSNNLPLLKSFLDAPHNVDPNHQDELGNTALHYAAMHGHSAIINTLLRRSDISSSITNNEKQTAYDLRENEPYTELSEILSIRLELDRKIHNAAFMLTVSYDYKAKEDDMSQAAKDIYSDYKNLPDYITEEFIAKMLFSQVQHLQLDSTSIYKPKYQFSQFNKTPLILLDEPPKK